MAIYAIGAKAVLVLIGDEGLDICDSSGNRWPPWGLWAPASRPQQSAAAGPGRVRRVVAGGRHRPRNAIVLPSACRVAVRAGLIGRRVRPTASAAAGAVNVGAFDALARQEAAAWARSPLAKAWRTGLVVISPDDLSSGPSGGFPSGQDKADFGNGDLVFTGPRPSGGPASSPSPTVRPSRCRR